MFMFWANLVRAPFFCFTFKSFSMAPQSQSFQIRKRNSQGFYSLIPLGFFVPLTFFLSLSGKRADLQILKGTKGRREGIKSSVPKSGKKITHPIF